MKRALIILGGAVLTAAIAGGMWLATADNGTAESAPRRPVKTPVAISDASDLTFEVALDPAVAGAVDRDELAATIEGTAEDALRGKLTVRVRFVERDIAAEIAAAREQAAHDAGLGEARARFAALLESDASFEELSAAQQDVQARREAYERLVSTGAGIPLAGDATTFAITADRLHGAHQYGETALVVVAAGLALEHYQDGERLQQSIANSVVQGMGTVAGLEPRAGSPTDAMTAHLDVVAGELAIRDDGPVHFTDSDFAAVVAALS